MNDYKTHSCTIIKSNGAFLEEMINRQGISGKMFIIVVTFRCLPPSSVNQKSINSLLRLLPTMLKNTLCAI